MWQHFQHPSGYVEKWQLGIGLNPLKYQVALIHLLTFFLSVVTGHSLLRSTMVVEKLGGWESGCFEDGPQPGNHF